MKTEILTITPSLARDMLKKNTGNFRKLDNNRVSNYAQQIADGEWHLNGESIKFSSAGVLLDGQHRLSAVIRADKPIECVVVWGVECSAVYIDRGKPRSVSQWVSHSGIKSANAVVATARRIVAYEKGIWHYQSWGQSCMTDADVIEASEKYHDGLHDVLAKANCNTKIPRSDLAAVMFIGSGYKNPLENELATWFLNGLIHGADLSLTDAVLHLKNRVTRGNATEQLTPFMVRMLLTLAWNKTVKDEPCSTLRIRLSGPQPQALPNKILVAS